MFVYWQILKGPNQIELVNFNININKYLKMTLFQCNNLTLKNCSIPAFAVVSELILAIAKFYWYWNIEIFILW